MHEMLLRRKIYSKATTPIVTGFKLQLFAGKHGMDGNLMRGLVLVVVMISALTVVAPRAQATSQCFTFALTPSSATIQRGGPSVIFQIVMTSVGGFSGTINIGVLAGGISPTTTSPPRVVVRNYDVWLPLNGKSGTIMTASATQSTVPTTYTITVTGKDITGGSCHGVMHTASVALTVT